MISILAQSRVRLVLMLFLPVLLGATYFVSCGDNPVDPGDTTRPTVVSVLPQDNDSTVSVNSVISATFSEAMSPASMVTGVLSITPFVNGALTYTGRTLTYTPTSGLDTNVTYTATIATTAADLAGNKMASAFTWQFSTFRDTLPPIVTATIPVDHDSTVTINRSITASFNEAMDITTLGATSFQITPSVAGSYQLTDRAMTFIPTNPLTVSQLYQAVITTAAADTAGNHLAQDYTWEFYTTPDVLSPEVVILSPEYGDVVSDLVQIDVAADDNDRIDRVEFYIDGSYIVGADDSTEPYQFFWNASSESIGTEHTIVARAFDYTGNEAVSDTVTVHYLWKLLIADPNEPSLPRNLSNIYYRATSYQIQFRVQTWNGWGVYDSDSLGIDVVFFLDTDQNPLTGDIETDSAAPKPIGDIGADYQMIVGFHGLYMQKWQGTAWGPIEGVEDLLIENDTNTFEVALSFSRLGNPSVIDVVMANIHVPTREWDWAPDTGHATATLDHTFLPTSSGVSRPKLYEPGTATSRTNNTNGTNPFD